MAFNLVSGWSRGQPMLRRVEQHAARLAAQPSACGLVAVVRADFVEALDRVADNRLAIDRWGHEPDEEERKPAHSAFSRCSTPAAIPAKAL